MEPKRIMLTLSGDAAGLLEELQQANPEASSAEIVEAALVALKENDVAQKAPRAPTHGELREQILETSLRLIDESQRGEVSADAVIQAMGVAPETPGLYDAFRAVNDQGELRCDFPGGMGLPYRIRR